MNENFKIALAQIIAEEGDYFYRYAQKLVRDRSLAEEAVQEMVRAALQNSQEFKGDSSLRTYLTAILKFKCIDIIRAEVKTRRTTVAHDISEYFNEDGHLRKDAAPKSTQPAADDAIFKKQLLKFLADCLRALNAEQRLIISLAELEEKSRAEVCNETGLTSTNVGVIAFRARNNLRLCIEKHTEANGARK